MEISIRENSGVVLINLSGSADMTAAGEMSKQLTEILSVNCKNVVIDLTELAFICSMGLGSLIRAYKQSLLNQGRLLLVNPQEEVSKVLRTTLLDQLFDIYPSVEVAVKDIDM